MSRKQGVNGPGGGIRSPAVFALEILRLRGYSSAKSRPMRNPSFWLALLIAAVSSTTFSFAEAGVDGRSAKLRAFSQAHEQLQSRQLALRHDTALIQTGGGQGLRAQLGAILTELPDQVKSYGAVQKELGIADDALIRKICAEAREAAALAPRDASFSAKVAMVRDDLARLLSDSTQRYPQMRSGNSGPPGGQGPRPSATGGAAFRMLHCANAGFDGTQGCASSSLANGGGRFNSPGTAGADRTNRAPAARNSQSIAGQISAGQTQTANASSGLLSGGHARLDRPLSGIDGFDGGASRVSAGDDLMPPADRMLAAALRRIAGDGKAINARDYLARYAALAASGKRDPRRLVGWEGEVKAYLQFKGGGGAMRGIQRGFAAVVNPSSVLGGKPGTAVSEACWQALAKEHPGFAQGCADNPKTAAVMAGAYQSVLEQAKGLVSPLSLALMLGSLLVGGLATGGVADVIALLLAIGFTAWMVWKIIRDYGPKLVSSLRGLMFSKSGSAESFRKWKDSAYYFTTTLVAVVGIFLGANGIAKLAGKLSSVTGRGLATARASSEAAAAAGRIEPMRIGAAGGEAVVATDALMAKAAAAEPRITAELQRVTEANGGELVGLKNRLKGAKSLTEKIATDMKQKGLSADEAAGKIGDTVRYTSILPEGSFTRGVDATLDGFKAKGYQVVKFKNTFQDGNIYKGINCQIRSPEGHLFELQFHTVESFELKSAMHADYEIYRDPSKTIKQWRAAFDRMQVAARGIKPPPGVDTLGQIQPLPARP
jgi:hypothetical protein